MGLYLIGDVQGCDEPLGRLLDEIGFSPSRDTLYLLGDLVNRGPQSAQVLRRLAGYGDAAQCLLGNHDLSLLAVAHGVRAPKGNDTMDSVLQAGDRDALLDWLRHRPLALQAHGWLMVHGGVLPQWDAAQVLALAGEVEKAVRAPDAAAFFREMYGNEPAQWSDALSGSARLRVIVNALTRLRFCSGEGVMNLKAGDGADDAPAGFMPWFEVPGRRTEGTPIAFGHWSQLGYLNRPGLLCLDSGCVWGGCLSAWRLDTGELRQVKCPQAQAPGAD
jgi:bis(5'-nucleosyl)-tetraphosphatase (symmetrical)